jgi:hypothetical protein
VGTFEIHAGSEIGEYWVEKYFDVTFDGLERHYGDNSTIPEYMYVVECCDACGDTHTNLLVGILNLLAPEFF